MENGVKLKSKTFDDSREIDLIHVDSEDVVQVGDSSSPTHIQGKNILINGKDLEEEIEKLHTELNEAGSDFEKITELSRILEEKQNEIDVAMEEWSALSLELEEL